jgi:hypothetical protein
MKAKGGTVLWSVANAALAHKKAVAKTPNRTVPNLDMTDSPVIRKKSVF